MLKIRLIFILCFISAQTFAQWKLFYPEKNQKQNKQEISEKDGILFNTHLFSALKAKSLEDYDQALKFFQECIKLNKSIATPYYESSLINKDLGNYNLAIEQIKKLLI